MKRMTVAVLATALMVGGASVAFSQSGTSSNTPRTESARAADRNDGFDWGWLGLLGLGGLAGLMGRDRRTHVRDYPSTTSTTTADRGTGRV
jgi:hypothetical protein